MWPLSVTRGWQWEELGLQDSHGVGEPRAERAAGAAGREWGTSRAVKGEEACEVRNNKSDSNQGRGAFTGLIQLWGRNVTYINHPWHSNSEWESVFSGNLFSLIADVDILQRQMPVRWRCSVCSRIQKSLRGMSSMRAVCTGWEDTRMLSLKSSSWRRRTCWSPGEPG